MKSLYWLSVACWGVAALNGALALLDRPLPYLAFSVSAASAAILTTALNRIVVLLTDIRDSLVTPSITEQTAPSVSNQSAQPVLAEQLKHRSAAEISADLTRMKAKHN